jgi:AcrR family transcriptional regulator
MQDVADAAGVSPGLLYTYAAGKEALFALVVQREVGVDIDALALPVADPEPAKLEALVRKAARALVASPTLDAAERSTRRPKDASAELARVVGEQYDGVHNARRFLKLVERCALDWPELADVFYGRMRRPFVQRLGRYIARRSAAGDFVRVPDAEVAARFVIETVAWFANHRYGDHDGAAIDDATARATVIELVTNSLTGGTR